MPIVIPKKAACLNNLVSIFRTFVCKHSGYLKKSRRRLIKSVAINTRKSKPVDIKKGNDNSGIKKA